MSDARLNQEEREAKMCVVFKAKLFCFWLIIGLVVFGGATGMFGETFTVNSLGDSVDVNPGDGVAVDRNGMCTLRAAIMEANALFGPDEIILPKRIINLSIKGYGEDQCRAGDLDITSNLTIRGQGKLISVIDGNQIDRVFHIRGAWHVTLADLTIRNGKAQDGACPPTGDAGAYARAGMGRHGGGILNVNGILLLERVAFKANASGDGGIGSFCLPGPGGWGGAVYNTGTLTARDCHFYRNTAGTGGSLYAWSSGLSGHTRASMSPKQFPIYIGHGGHGGGICNNGGIVTVENCEFLENKAGNAAWSFGSYCGGHGGGVFNLNGEATIKNTYMCKNSGGHGAGIEELGNGGSGGAIYTSESTLLVENCLIHENTGGVGGDCISPGYCLVRGGSGGGIYSSSSDTRILNTTISYNQSGEAGRAGYGGGIYQNEGRVELNHCTIFHNSCGRPEYDTFDERGGGVYGHNVFAQNTIIYGNLVSHSSYGNDIYGTLHSLGYNLIGDSRDFNLEGDTTGNIIGEDPLLKPLANNGGACMTYALFPSSPALDAADPSDTEETDQRGVKRPQDGDGDGSPRSDIGAFELSFPSVRIVAPENGAVVRGDVRFAFEAENYEYVSVSLSYAPFYAELREEPLEFVWHTFWWYPRGPYRVKAAAVDGMGQIAQTETGFYLDNLRMELIVTKGVERSWLIQKEYADLDLTLWMLEIELIDHLEVQRKVGGGAYRTIKTAPLEEYKTGKYRYQDILPRTKSVIMYRVVAYDKDGNELGTSPKRQVL